MIYFEKENEVIVLLKDIKESGVLSEKTEKSLISKIKDFIKGI